ncbi:MAG: carboxypeptidase regulatory-like domain-containing protein [Terriglobales bacterium]
MKIRLFCTIVFLMALFSATLLHAQDTASVTGTVLDSSGASVANAQVTVSAADRGINRTTTTNSDGAYSVAALPPGSYDISVSAQGFKKYQAKGVILRVAQKARVDVPLQVGAATTEVTVEGVSVAQVETQSSDLSGTVTGREISQLQLNGRNFAQLVTLVPGVVSQTGQDEGTVGVYGNVAYSINGGRTEYNNWEIDGGDNMDNGSNSTLNVYPSLDAIAEFKVLTSNYGAQYGRNGSGTVEVETKSGTNAFHGDVFYFGRNDAFNARNFFDDATAKTPTFKKHDFGYTIGGPIRRDKTYFFFSEEWRRDLVPGQVFHVAVPSDAERGINTPGFGDFSDVCTGPDTTDCPGGPSVPDFTAVPIDPNAQAILAMIPQSNADVTVCGGAPFVGCFNASPANKTTWREELVRVDHNFSPRIRAMFRYIHDSWQTVTPTTLWGCPDGCSFPTIQTGFVGPGTSAVARLTATVSPTLLNEFVFSYTADHIFLANTGPGAVARPAGMTMTGIFPDFGNKLPGIELTGNAAYGTLEEDNAYIPWNNANPTYTLRDNVSKIVGKHNLQFGAYLAIAQKNEQSSFGSQQGFLTFDASNSNVSSGNSFADFLLGNISSFQQVNSTPKYYFRYKILEPYFQDDWHITPHLTLNLGVRISLFQTYREKQNQTFNFQQSAFVQANAPAIGADGSLIDPVTGEPLSIDDPRDFNGMVHCGGSGVPPGCVQGHLFNPAPRLGFAWDPKGDGKWAVRGGYGIFYEHGNGNEQNVEALEATPPLVLNPTQPNITGYTSISAGAAFPLGFNAIATKGRWPYVQQYNLNVQHELPQHIVATLAYVGSKGTHLGRRLDLNQVPDLTGANPYQPGEPITPPNPPSDPTYTGDCNTLTTHSGTPITGDALLHLNIACGGDPSPLRPFVGFSSINFLQFAASSTYNALQFSARRSLAPLTVGVSYTYSHSIDDASDGAFGNNPSFIDSYNLKSGRASSDFDVRHMLSISWIYDLPFFRGSGFANKLLGGWQYSGIMATQTGTPFSVTFSGFSDNAGVSNGAGPGTYADMVGNPNANVPAHDPGSPPFLYNPAAFADPQGLTFGNSGRNSLRNPRTTNFDMALFKHFKVTERTAFEFRAEAFNIFNHTQWSGVNNDEGSPADFLQPSGAHRARTVQFGAKFIF